MVKWSCRGFAIHDPMILNFRACVAGAGFNPTALKRRTRRCLRREQPLAIVPMPELLLKFVAIHAVGGSSKAVNSVLLPWNQ
jgi:hypothetical protein